MNSVHEKLAEKFKIKEYRDAFVAEQIFSRLPLKIRGIRESQNLTQRDFAQVADMKQTWVSKLEDPSYGKLTISTLLKLASAFDVGLQIDFVPFSRILDEATRMSADSFSVPKFEEDLGFIANSSSVEAVNATIPAGALGNVIMFRSSDQAREVASALVPPGSASQSVAQLTA